MPRWVFEQPMRVPGQQLRGLCRIRNAMQRRGFSPPMHGSLGAVPRRLRGLPRRNSHRHSCASDGLFGGCLAERQGRLRGRRSVGRVPEFLRLRARHRPRLRQVPGSVPLRLRGRARHLRVHRTVRIRRLPAEPRVCGKLHHVQLHPMQRGRQGVVRDHGAQWPVPAVCIQYQLRSVRFLRRGRLLQPSDGRWRLRAVAANRRRSLLRLLRRLLR